MFQSVRVAAGGWLLAVYYRQSWKKSKVYKFTFFQDGTWRQVAMSRCTATCSHLLKQPLASTCSHLQPLAATRPSSRKWLQVAAGGCKCLQVAASDCFFQNQNDARLLTDTLHRDLLQRSCQEVSHRDLANRALVEILPGDLYRDLVQRRGEENGGLAQRSFTESLRSLTDIPCGDVL